MAAALELKSVGRHYDQGGKRLDILLDCDFALHSGEMVALVAPSGAGSAAVP